MGMTCMCPPSSNGGRGNVQAPPLSFTVVPPAANIPAGHPWSPSLTGPLQAPRVKAGLSPLCLDHNLARWPSINGSLIRLLLLLLLTLDGHVELMRDDPLTLLAPSLHAGQRPILLP